MGSEQDLFYDFIMEHMGRTTKELTHVASCVWMTSYTKTVPRNGIASVQLELAYVNEDHSVYVDLGPESYLVEVLQDEIDFLSGFSTFAPLIAGPEPGTVSGYLVNMSKSLNGGILATDRIPQVIDTANGLWQGHEHIKMMLLHSFLIWRLKRGT